MKIVEIKVLRGPNYWSVRRSKLIQIKLDLEEMEQKPTNLIPGFRERLEAMFPTMYEHRCSEGVLGGFFSRVDEGTWMGHVIEHIALKFRRWPEWIQASAAQEPRKVKKKVCIMLCLLIWKKMPGYMLQKLRFALRRHWLTEQIITWQRTFSR